MRSPSGKWELSGFGTNLLNKIYLTGGFFSPLLQVDDGTIGSPSIVGGIHPNAAAPGDMAVGSSAVGLSAFGSGSVGKLNISSSTAPTVTGILSGFGAPGIPVAMSSGTVGYAQTFIQNNPSQGAFKVLDTSGSIPSIMGTVTMGGIVSAYQVVGTNVFVAAAGDGLRVVDVTTPSAPMLSGHVNTPTACSGIAVNTTVIPATAYLVCGASGSTSVAIVDVSTPSSPQLGTPLVLPVTDVATTGSRLYVVNGISLKSFDISTPGTPVLLGTLNGSFEKVAVSGTTVYAAHVALTHTDAAEGLYVINAAPATPVQLQRIIVPGTIGSIVPANGKIYLGDSAATVDIISP